MMRNRLSIPLKLSPVLAVYQPGSGIASDSSKNVSESSAAVLPTGKTLEEALEERVPEQARPPITGGLAVDEDRHLTFEQIHRKYEKKIYNLILRNMSDPEDAEELTNETFVNAWRAWDRFRGEARVSTWLYQIAINNCRNRLKQRKRQREHEAMSLDDSIETDSGEMSREIADWRDVPERALLDKEMQQKVREAVEALRPEYREVLLLRESEGMSYEEIAEVTGQSVPAIKTRLHRARLYMRQRLDPYYRGR